APQEANEAPDRDTDAARLLSAGVSLLALVDAGGRSRIAGRFRDACISGARARIDSNVSPAVPAGVAGLQFARAAVGFAGADYRGGGRVDECRDAAHVGPVGRLLLVTEVPRRGATLHQG